VQVLHVTAPSPLSWAYGGIPRAVRALVGAQRAAGMHPRVWSTDALDATRRASSPSTLDGAPLATTRTLSRRLAWAHQLYLPLGAPPSLAGVDLVHLHGHRHALNALAYRAARRAGLPVVLTAHGTVPRLERKVTLKRAWDLFVDGHVPTGADAVVATSRAEARDLLACGVDGARIHRIPNALTLSEFDDLPTRAEARARLGLGEGPLVAYLGQVTPRKRVDALAAAFDGEALAPAQLVVAGPARGMAVPAGVTHLGVLEGPARVDLLVAADVLAYPSAREAFGLVPLEGLLCGTPVLVGDDCGCGELVADAGAGLLVDGSVEGIRRAVRRLLEAPEEAGRMVARGRTWIARHLAPAQVAEAHRDLYRSVLAAPRTRERA
jgi:glycosyltransferase involved in cell wall biosynthesis